MRGVAILGSARSDGGAAALLDAIAARHLTERFDLARLHIADYAYDREGAADDDFLRVAQAMVEAEHILFVTPVYWYAMSAVLKRFFDRLTELTSVHKTVGRQLAGRSAWVAACGAQPALPDGFEVPFRDTAGYFDMAYRGAFYVQLRGGASLSERQARAAARFGAEVLGGGAFGPREPKA